MATQTKAQRAQLQSPDAQSFAVDAARLASDTRCRQVSLLDVRGLSPVTDYMVIATGTSPRQMRTVIDDLQEWAETRGSKAMSRAGYEGENWVLLDFVDVIVHVMSEQARYYYDLDNLWGDARRIDWQAGYTPKQQ